MALGGVPKFLRPCLRLFLSVDLVGSTALKQSDFPIKAPTTNVSLRDAGTRWIPELASFYQDVDSLFQSEWNQYCAKTAPKHGWPQGKCARLWKINGDELLYVRELKSGREAVAFLWCWRQACRRFRTQLSEKQQTLDVKMTAWTAGFPITNTEVIFQRKMREEFGDWDPLTLHYHLLELSHSAEDNELIQDFIGPTIDIGFRIASRATPRKFIVSLDLAYILTTISVPSSLTLNIGFDGVSEFKGVYGGKPYPIFWIDTHDDHPLSSAEDKLRGGRPHRSREDISAFCEEYIQSTDAHVFKPFIFGDTEPLLSEMPDHYVAKLRSLAKAWKNAKESRSIYLSALSGKSPPEVGAPPPPSGKLSLNVPIKDGTKPLRERGAKRQPRA